MADIHPIQEHRLFKDACSLARRGVCRQQSYAAILSAQESYRGRCNQIASECSVTALFVHDVIVRVAQIVAHAATLRSKYWA